MFAAMGGHLLVVKALLGHGADPLALARDGWAALHFAESRGHAQVASLLRQAEDREYQEGMPILKAMVAGVAGPTSPGGRGGESDETDSTGRDTGHLGRGRHTARHGIRHTRGATHAVPEG